MIALVRPFSSVCFATFSMRLDALSENPLSPVQVGSTTHLIKKLPKDFWLMNLRYLPTAVADEHERGFNHGGN